MNCRKMRALEHKNTQPLGTSHTGRPGTSRLLTDPQGLWVETVDSLALGPSPSCDRQPELEGGNCSPRETLSTKLQASFFAN